VRAGEEITWREKQFDHSRVCSKDGPLKVAQVYCN
jgi:hypothetical protein